MASRKWLYQNRKKMTQEEKQLLLKDLCGRLLYGVIVEATYKDEEGWKTEDRKFKGLYDDGQVYVDAVYTNIENVKPYLRSISSITEEEKKELFEAIDKDMNLLEETLDKEPLFTYHNNRYMGNPIHYELDFLISHHFDYRGLIPKGLALEAPEGMYKN